jgi:hypothetical protein
MKLALGFVVICGICSAASTFEPAPIPQRVAVAFIKAASCIDNRCEIIRS